MTTLGRFLKSMTVYDDDQRYVFLASSCILLLIATKNMQRKLVLIRLLLSSVYVAHIFLFSSKIRKPMFSIVVRASSHERSTLDKYRSSIPECFDLYVLNKISSGPAGGADQWYLLHHSKM